MTLLTRLATFAALLRVALPALLSASPALAQHLSVSRIGAVNQASTVPPGTWLAQSEPTRTPLLPFVLGGMALGLGHELLTIQKRIGYPARLSSPYTPRFLVARGALLGGSAGALTGQIVRAFRDDAPPRRAPLILTGAAFGASLAATAAIDEVAHSDAFFGEIFVAAAALAGGVTGSLLGFITQRVAASTRAKARS